MCIPKMKPFQVLAIIIIIGGVTVKIAPENERQQLRGFNTFADATKINLLPNLDTTETMRGKQCG